MQLNLHSFYDITRNAQYANSNFVLSKVGSGGGHTFKLQTTTNRSADAGGIRRALVDALSAEGLSKESMAKISTYLLGNARGRTSDPNAIQNMQLSCREARQILDFAANELRTRRNAATDGLLKMVDKFFAPSPAMRQKLEKLCADKPALADTLLKKMTSLPAGDPNRMKLLQSFVADGVGKTMANSMRAAVVRKETLHNVKMNAYYAQAFGTSKTAPKTAPKTSGRTDARPAVKAAAKPAAKVAAKPAAKKGGMFDDFVNVEKPKVDKFDEIQKRAAQVIKDYQAKGLVGKRPGLSMPHVSSMEEAALEAELEDLIREE